MRVANRGFDELVMGSPCIDQSSDGSSRMNRAFHDARLASTPSFASSWGVFFTT